MSVRLKQVSIIDYALMLVIVVALIGGFYLYQQKGNSEDKRANLEQRLSRARASLSELSDSTELATLTDQLEELKTAPEAHLFPTREEASNLFPAIAARARERSVNITNFTSAEASIPLAELDSAERPAISYILSAEGKAEDLLGVLGLLDEYPTAVVRDLALEGKNEQWVMNLGLAVFYRVEAGGDGAATGGG